MHDFQLVTLTLNLFFTHLYFAVHRPLYTRTNSQRASDTVGAWLPWLTNRSWVTDWWEAVTWLALYVRAATESDVSDHRHHRLSPSAASLEKAFAFALAPRRIAFSFSYTRVQERRWSVRVQLHVFIYVFSYVRTLRVLSYSIHTKDETGHGFARGSVALSGACIQYY